MRKSQDVLLTILDVLLHDPLYEWTVPSAKSPSQTSSKVEAQGIVSFSIITTILFYIKVNADVNS